MSGKVALSSHLRTEVDGQARLGLYDEEGKQLRPVAPIVRWERSESPRCTRASENTWKLVPGPSDLIATIHQARPGQYEEHRFSIVIQNKGESEITGNLLPVLTEWYGRKDI